MTASGWGLKSGWINLGDDLIQSWTGGIKTLNELTSPSFPGGTSSYTCMLTFLFNHAAIFSAGWAFSGCA
jgi:hypothetical protein